MADRLDEISSNIAKEIAKINQRLGERRPSKKESAKVNRQIAKALYATARPTDTDLLRYLSMFRRLVDSNDQCISVFQEFRGHEVRPKKIKIAVLCVNLENKLAQSVGSKRGFPSSLYTIKPEVFEEYSQRFVELVERACKWGANFVCANELSFPNVDDRKLSAETKKRYHQARNKLDRKLIKLANEYHAFVIAGTFHDVSEVQNTCPIYHIDPSGKRRFKTKHVKLTSAELVGEYVRIPEIRRIPCYQSKYGSFGIFICLDSYDASLVMKLMKNNMRLVNAANKRHLSREDFRDHVGLVFVPSLNEESENAVALCKDISYAGACISVFSNCGSKRNKQAVYMADKQIEPDPKLNDTEVVGYEIEKEDFSRMIRTIEQEYHPHLQFVLGKREAVLYG